MNFHILGGSTKHGAQKTDFVRGRHYLVPEGATHIRIFSSEICFGVCDDKRPFVKTGKGNFYKIPREEMNGKKIMAVSFGDPIGRKFYGTETYVIK